MKKKMKKIDEREIVAKEFYKFLTSCAKQGIEEDYSLFLAFCITGGLTLQESRQRFYCYIDQVLANNQG